MPTKPYTMTEIAKYFPKNIDHLSVLKDQQPITSPRTPRISGLKSQVMKPTFLS